MKEVSDLPTWFWMWVLVGSLWLVFKVMAFFREGGPSLVLPQYFFWVGTEAAPFRRDRVESRRLKVPISGPIVFILIALALVFVVVPSLTNPILVGWLGLISMLCLLHFGLFDLFAAFWNARGYPVERIMDAPWRATSLGEFWGQRWNRAFSRWARVHVFRPLVRRHGTIGGTVAGFLASGLAHEIVISLPAGGGWGLPTLYFLIQAAALLLQRSCGALRGIFFTLAAVLIPAPLLFHVPFIETVFAPMTRFFAPAL